LLFFGYFCLHLSNYNFNLCDHLVFGLILSCKSHLLYRNKFIFKINILFKLLPVHSLFFLLLVFDYCMIGLFYFFQIPAIICFLLFYLFLQLLYIFLVRFILYLYLNPLNFQFLYVLLDGVADFKITMFHNLSLNELKLKQFFISKWLV
jgi:hypothetical protein